MCILIIFYHLNGLQVFPSNGKKVCRHVAFVKGKFLFLSSNDINLISYNNVTFDYFLRIIPLPHCDHHCICVQKSNFYYSEE